MFAIANADSIAPVAENAQHDPQAPWSCDEEEIEQH